MKKKSKIILISVLAAVVVIYGLVLWGIDYVLIPKVVIPKMWKYIEENVKDPVKLVIKDISFHPFKGFLLEDVKLSGPVALKDDYILHAKLVDVDLAFIPLLWKRIEVKQFEMTGVDFNIGRNEKGQWNFQPLLNLDFMKEKDVGKTGFKFTVKKFILEKCNLDYEDHFKKDNKLERRFTNIELHLTNPKRNLYKITLQGGDPDRSKESIELKLECNRRKKSAEGKFKLNTTYLDEYWDYYLDDMLSPWHLKADNIDFKMKFSYNKGTLLLNGEHAVCDGVLTYGDLSIRGNGKVVHKLKYVKGALAKDIARIKISLDDITSLSGEYVLLDKGKCGLIITEEEIDIRKMSGVVMNQPLHFTGKFVFGEPGEFSLTGKIASVQNSFNLKVLPNNQGTADWNASLGSSNVKLHADISDLKNMVFDLNMEGDLQLPDLLELAKTSRDKAKGKIGFSGNIKGEMDDVSSLQGELTVNAEDFSILHIKPQTFGCNVNVKDGIFTGAIPKEDFYKGNFYGTIQADFHKCGIELHVDNLDIEEFVKGEPKLEGMNGTFTGSAAYVSKWTGLHSGKGGGYFQFTSCNLWKAPIFKQTEKGLESVTEKMDMPPLDKLEGNFEIKENGIIVENVFCDAEEITLQIKGKYRFSGETEFTIGVSFSKGTIFRTIRQVLVPVTIGIDLLQNSFQVNINGKWPDIGYKIQIQPAQWLNAFFPSVSGAKPDKYTLGNVCCFDVKKEDTRKRKMDVNYLDRRKNHFNRR